MSDTFDIQAVRNQPFGKRITAYWRYTGPGYLQSAMTLGGGTVASCAALGSQFGYKYLWVQLLAMGFGLAILSSVAKQTTHSGERPYGVFWNLLHPAFAILWAASAFIATILWHIPQYSLTANGVIVVVNYKSSRSLAQNRTIPKTVEGTTGTFGVFIPGQQVNQIFAGQINGIDIRSAGSNDHTVDGTTLNPPHRFR